MSLSLYIFLKTVESKTSQRPGISNNGEECNSGDKTMDNEDMGVQMDDKWVTDKGNTLDL